MQEKKHGATAKLMMLLQLCVDAVETPFASLLCVSVIVRTPHCVLGLTIKVPEKLCVARLLHLALCCLWLCGALLLLFFVACPLVGYRGESLSLPAALRVWYACSQCPI